MKFIILVFLSPILLFGYLDPGSGSMLMYFIIGIFATLTYSIKNLFFQAKIFIYRLFNRDKISLKDTKNIVFYSEGGHHWHSFKSIIEELCSMEIECSYYTSDKQDIGLTFKDKYFDSLFIGESRFSLMSLNYLKANILVTTIPHIDVMHFKRSKDVNYFIHLTRSNSDAFNYHPFAFDFFDCVMCAGDHQIRHIRIIEKHRNLQAKKLLETGLVYFDELVKNRETNKKQNKQKIVLLAPTWGENGLFNKLGFIPLEVLSKANFQVIVRPHPQSFINDANLMKHILSECEKYDSISIDRNPSAEESMQKADIMISDTSAIIFDFSFVYEKPIIAFSNTLEDDRLSEITLMNTTKNITEEIWEMKAINKIANVIDVEDIDSLAQLTLKALTSNFIDNIKEVREKSLFNYGNAGKIGAKQIKQIMDSQC